MVTRRKFLATNVAAAALSTLGIHRPLLADAAKQDQRAKEDRRDRTGISGMTGPITLPET